MIRINLLPVRPRRTLIPEPQIVGTLLAVVIAIGATYLYEGWRMAQLNTEINQITAATAALNPRVEDVLQLESEIEDLQSRESLLDALDGQALPWSDLLTDLARRTPGDVWLANVSSVGNQAIFSIQGTAHNYTSLGAFMSSLRGSPYYGTVTLGTAQDTDTQTDTTQAVQFGLTLTLRPPQAPPHVQTTVVRPDLQGIAP